MGFHASFNPFDKSLPMYYQEAQHEEEGTRQVLAVEDISIDLAEDLVFIISGAEKGEGQPTTSDIDVVNSRDGKGAKTVFAAFIAK